MDKLKAKVVLTYSLGCCGPKDVFFTEKLIITAYSIEYKKEWDANKYGMDELDNPRVDISWKLKSITDTFVQVLHETNSFLGFDLGPGICVDRDVCDGDILEYDVTLPDGEHVKNHIFMPAYPEIIEKLKNYIKPFIKGMPCPSFLK